MRRALPLTLLAALALSALPSPAAAAPRASLVDIEDEVMCPICGTLLELSESPQAARERAFIARLIAAGRTKQEIKDALVAEYGREVLAVPGSSGFDLSAYLVPIVVFVVCGLALGGGILRWRRRSPPPTEDAVRGPQGKEAERLEADLRRYDL
jgi:cytochrome c-type biogenesis protein CcmH